MCHCVHEWTEIHNNICHTSTCEGAIKVHPECCLESVPLWAFQLTATEQLQERWRGETAFSDTAPSKVILATALDPRFKSVFHLLKSYTVYVQTKVQTMALEQKREMDVQQHSSCSSTSTNTPAAESTPPATLLDSLLGSDGEDKDRASEGDDVQNQKRNEVLTYFGGKNLAKEENALQWWKANRDRYPMLTRLAKSYLCIPGTSTPSERLFSAAGNVASKKRASLSQEHVGMLNDNIFALQCELPEERE